MPDTRKIPMRMCVACRTLKGKNEMLRIVRDGSGKISVDFSGKAPGRGAYICGNPECIAKMRKQRSLNKVFSCDVPDEVYKAIEEDYLGRRQD